MRVSFIVLICSVVLSIFTIDVNAFISPLISRPRLTSKVGMEMSVQDMMYSQMPHIMSTLQLADTSVSEEEVLDVVGQTQNLPDPLLTVTFALVLIAGIAVLQFSLGDLSKEEGQARVRDFLQTRKDTERKRGYFD
mmetsp:Transcript_10674/g.10320  ORF Transcript_10674/g.10320 Transcript_10674/m.10320 type:complete len:136 (+) Transcript_10674:134-541(+)